MQTQRDGFPAVQACKEFPRSHSLDCAVLLETGYKVKSGLMHSMHSVQRDIVTINIDKL